MSKTTNQTAAGITVERYAMQLGVSPGRVRQWIGEGRLPVVGENPYLIDPGTPRPERQKTGPKPVPKKKS